MGYEFDRIKKPEHGRLTREGRERLHFTHSCKHIRIKVRLDMTDGKLGSVIQTTQIQAAEQQVWLKIISGFFFYQPLGKSTPDDGQGS